MRSSSVGIVLAVAGVLFAADARAAGSKCDYHTDCSDGHLCHRGRCRKTQKVVEKFSAEETCGNDRRCRIHRLKEINRARRHARLLEERRFARKKADQFEESEIAKYPRIDRPISIDWRVSRLGALGLAAGYTFFGRLRAELHFVRFGQYDVGVQHNDQYFDGTQSVNWLIPGVAYFFTDGQWAPYTGLSFVYGWGRDATSPGIGVGDDAAGELDTEYHGVELKGGIDFQMQGEGAHMRLGLAYRPLIYNQARISAGTYSETRRDVLEKWFKQLGSFDVMFLAGWAF